MLSQKQVNFEHYLGLFSALNKVFNEDENVFFGRGTNHYWPRGTADELLQGFQNYTKDHSEHLLEKISKDELIDLKEYLQNKGLKEFSGTKMDKGILLDRSYSLMEDSTKYKCIQVIHNNLKNLLDVINNTDIESITPAFLLLTSISDKMENVFNFISDVYKLHGVDKLLDNVAFNDKGANIPATYFLNMFNIKNDNYKNADFYMTDYHAPHFTGFSLLLNYVEEETKKNSDYYNVELLKIDNYLINNSQGLKSIFKKHIDKNIVPEDINKNIEIYKNKPEINLYKVNQYLNLSANNIANILGDKILNADLFSSSFYYTHHSSLIMSAERKEKFNKNEDQFLLNLLNNMLKVYGKKNIEKLMNDLSRLAEEEYSNVVLLKKIPEEKKRKLFVWHLLNKEHINTLNFCIMFGYNPSVMEKEYIMKKRVLKAILPKEIAESWKEEKNDTGIEESIKKAMLCETASSYKEFKDMFKNNKKKALDLLLKNKDLDIAVLYDYGPKVKIEKEVLVNKSLLMTTILNGNPNSLNILLENNIPLTEKEMALCYLPLTDSKKIYEVEEFNKNFKKYIDNNNVSTLELTVNVLKNKPLSSQAYNNTLIIDKLIEKNINQLSEREKLNIFSMFYADHEKLLILNHLNEENKELFLKCNGSKNIMEYLNRFLHFPTNKEYQKVSNIFENSVKKIIENDIGNNKEKEIDYINWIGNRTNYGVNIVKAELEKRILMRSYDNNSPEIEKTKRRL